MNLQELIINRISESVIDKSIESQVNPRLMPKVIKKFGKYTLEFTKAGLVVSDNVNADWITIYSNGTWASDGVLGFPKSLKDYLDKNAQRLSTESDEYKELNKE